MRVFGGLMVAAVLATAAPAQKAKDPLKVQSAAAFQGANDLVIGSFTIGFITERTDKAKAGGGLMGGGFGGRSTARSYLAGVSAADLQSIADAAFADFKDRLAQRGFTIAPAASLYGDAAFAKAKPMAAPYEASIMFDGDAKAKAQYFVPAEQGQLFLFPGDVMNSGLGAIGANMASMQSQMGAAAFAKARGQGVVNILYLVDFADADKYGGWFRSSSAVKVKAGLAIAPGSKLTLIAPSGKVGTVALKDPVAIGGDFAEVSDSTSGADKAGQAVANVIGILGGVGTNSSRKYTFAARPAQYRTASLDAAGQANALLVERLTSLR